MDEKFQDRIDNYLLNRMDDAEKTEFLREVEQDKEKKEQLEFTQNVKDCIRSREEKKLDAILKEMPTIESYDALKTKKNKCMNALRKSAKEIYKRKLNS